MSKHWNPGICVIIWEYSLRAIQWVPTWQGLDFQKYLLMFLVHCQWQCYWTEVALALPLKGPNLNTKTVEMREDPTNLPSSLDNCITISSRCTWHRFEAGSLLPFPVDTIAATRHWNIPRSVYKTIWRDNIDYSVISLCAVLELRIGQHQSTDDHPDWLVHSLWVWCIFSTTDGASHSHPFGWRLTGDFYDGPSVKEQIKKRCYFHDRFLHNGVNISFYFLSPKKGENKNFFIFSP